ncbi:MAG: hypothetical protein II594_03525 [Clostridium sp.]|nr:hypothetical protein [Clostridium sp.]
MDKKYIAYGLVFLNAIIQLASCFWYSDLPGFVWTLADSIVILVPLVFGLRMGLLNLLPVAVSEFVWFFKLGVPGPLLHLAAFTVAVLLMATAHRRLAAMPGQKRAVLSGILYIAGLAGEELLYHGLRLLFLQKPVNWDAFYGAVFSPVVLMVLLLVVFVSRPDRRKENYEA